MIASSPSVSGSFLDLDMPILDLRGAYAKLDWADGQLNILDAEARTFLARNPYRVVADTNPDFTGRVLIIELTEQIPTSLRTGVGMVVQAFRDSLDYLAVALAEHNGAVEPKDVYFPIADSKERFAERATQRKMRRLSTKHREIITGLEPYKGGNDLLFALNSLCNKSKHRALLAFIQSAMPKTISGNGYVRRLTVFPPGTSLYDGKPFAVLDADPNIDLQFSISIAFSEAVASKQTFIETLREFSRLVNAIINLFR
jgi:hypothetical protein